MESNTNARMILDDVKQILNIYAHIVIDDKALLAMMDDVERMINRAKDRQDGDNTNGLPDPIQIGGIMV